MGEPAGRSKAEGEFTQDISALQPSPGNEDPEDAGDRAGSGTLYNPRQGQAGRGLPFDNKTLEGGAHGRGATWSVWREWGQIQVTPAPGRLDPHPLKRCWEETRSPSLRKLRLMDEHPGCV